MTACPSPPMEALLDYWSGDLPAGDAGELEEHLFACEACAGRLAGIEELAASIRRLTETGRFRAAVAPSLVDLLDARGLRIRTYRPPAGGSIPCTSAAKDQLLVARLAADLGGATRVDVAVCDERWAERERQADVPFDRRRGEVVFAERTDRPELRTAHVVRLRLLAVGLAGEREIGTFALEHDPGELPAGD